MRSGPIRLAKTGPHRVRIGMDASTVGGDVEGHMANIDRNDTAATFVWSEIPCEFCAEFPQYLPADRGRPFVRAARWAVVVKDCCLADSPVDYLLCAEHWSMIRDQPLPGQCRRCGAIAHSLNEIVVISMPVGKSVAGFFLGAT